MVALGPSPNGPPSLHDVARGRRVEAMNPALAKGTKDAILPGNQQISGEYTRIFLGCPLFGSSSQVGFMLELAGMVGW